MKRVLIRHKGSIKYATVDAEDFFLVSQYTWWLKGKGYVYTQTEGRRKKTVYLHRLILKATDYQEIDHINRNPKDNRRSNLRFCTRSENNLNISNSHGVGRFRDKWRARIKKNRKEVHIGVFNTKKEAIEARKKVETLFYPNFKRT